MLCPCGGTNMLQSASWRGGCFPNSALIRALFLTARIARLVFRAVGTVRFRQETNLAFTSAGRIASIYVDVGQRVEKRQQLALLDTTTVSAQMSAANAEQVRAGAELQRSKQLYAQGWVSKARLDNAQAAYDTASSSGVILSRLAEPTQVVSEGTPVLTLGEEARGHVLRIPVSDRDVSDIVAGHRQQSAFCRSKMQHAEAEWDRFQRMLPDGSHLPKAIG
jgi:hypothetical protein